MCFLKKSKIVPLCSVIRSKQFDNDQTALISGKNLKTHDTVAKIKACDSIRLIFLLFCWFLHYLIAMTSPTRVKEGVISTSSSMVVKRHSGFTFSFCFGERSGRAAQKHMMHAVVSVKTHQTVVLYASVLKEGHMMVFVLHALILAFWVLCALLHQESPLRFRKLQ